MYCIVRWLRRLFNVCFRVGVVLDDWQSECIVPLYTVKEKVIR